MLSHAKQVIAESDHLNEIADLMRTVSALTDPQAIQREFSRRMTTFSGTEGYMSVSTRGLPLGHYKITRSMLDRDALQNNALNPWAAWETLPTHSGGFLGEAIASDRPKYYPDLHCAGDPVLGDRIAGFRSVLVMPLFDEGRALNWGVILRRDPDAFTRQDMEEFLYRGNLIGRMTRNLIIRGEVERLNRQLTEQLEEIAAVQRALLPDRTPSVPGLSIASSFLTSQHAGGDYFDYFDLNDGRWGVLIADASGHGAGAATVVAMMNSIMHAHASSARGPAEMLAHANYELARKQLGSRFVTAFLGFFDPARRTITYSNAGHLRPMLHDAGGVITELRDAASLPLGILPDDQYEEASHDLDQGQTLILYTDGITEAFSPAPERDMFGAHRLHEALVTCTGEPTCVIESIHRRLFEHTGSRNRDDDQTIVAVRVEA